MMHQIVREQLSKFLADQHPPCVSLYMPTHRRHPENQQDPIRFRNLLQRLEGLLSQDPSNRETGKKILTRLQTLSHDEPFWNRRTEGLAILSSPDAFQIFDLYKPVEELMVVADSFHIKPLLWALQATDRFQVLGLNRHAAKLYEGNRKTLNEIKLNDGVPATIEEALGSELTEAHLTVGSYGGSGRPGHGSPSMHHGHGQKKEEVEIDNQRFFRAVDRAILEHHSRPTRLPLLLAALAEHHDVFRKISHNPFLLEVGIKLDPQSVSGERLRSAAWQVMEPYFMQRIAKYIEDFQTAQSQQLGASDLTDIAHALIAGRVGVLLVEADREIPGKLDPATGSLEFLALEATDVDDLLDDFAELALKMGGEVMIIPAEQMPSTSGAAATYRY